MPWCLTVKAGEENEARVEKFKNQLNPNSTSTSSFGVRFVREILFNP